MGGYSAIDMEAVAALQPRPGDRLEERQSRRASRALCGLGIPVFVNEPRSMDDVARSLERIGTLAGTGETAKVAASSFRERRDELFARYARRPRCGCSTRSGTSR